MSHYPPPPPMNSWPPPHTIQNESQVLLRNSVDMTREMLIQVLTYFSSILPNYFGSMPIFLIVHGGAAMLLNPRLHGLAGELEREGHDRRKTTRDVDVVLRNFNAEYFSSNRQVATETLRQAIHDTARQFGLGADWMNCDADVALPMALHPYNGQTYDPIRSATVTPENMSQNTIFVSPTRNLTLVSVPQIWAIALKLVRYTRRDASDIVLLLREARGTNWTPDLIEQLIQEHCWPMGHNNYDSIKRMEFKQRTKHLVELMEWLSRPASEQPSMSEMTRRLEQLPFRPPNYTSQAPVPSQHSQRPSSELHEAPVGALWSPPPQQDRRKEHESTPFVPPYPLDHRSASHPDTMTSSHGVIFPAFHHAKHDPNNPVNPYLIPRQNHSWQGPSWDQSSSSLPSNLSTPPFFPPNLNLVQGPEPSSSSRDTRHKSRTKSQGHDREHAKNQDSRISDRFVRGARQLKQSLLPTGSRGDHAYDASSDSSSDSSYEFVDRPSNRNSIPAHLQARLNKKVEEEPAPVIPELHNRFYRPTPEECRIDPPGSSVPKPRRIPSWAQATISGTEIPSSGPLWAPTHATVQSSRPGNALEIYNL